MSIIRKDVWKSIAYSLMACLTVIAIAWTAMKGSQNVSQTANAQSSMQEEQNQESMNDGTDQNVAVEDDTQWVWQSDKWQSAAVSAEKLLRGCLPEHDGEILYGTLITERRHLRQADCKDISYDTLLYIITKAMIAKYPKSASVVPVSTAASREGDTFSLALRFRAKVDNRAIKALIGCGDYISFVITVTGGVDDTGHARISRVDPHCESMNVGAKLWGVASKAIFGSSDYTAVFTELVENVLWNMGRIGTDCPGIDGLRSTGLQLIAW